MSAMTVLDLFSGAAGGWSLGLHRAGFETVAACEIEPDRRAAFAFNNPGVRMYEDVRTLTADRLRRDLGFLPECVVGSPPCQDASTANTSGRGVDGERTGLFFDAIRLVGEIRPRWVCLENVPGLRARGSDRVLAALEALGYTPWPLVVGAWHAGAPHKRNRVWIVAADLSGDGWGQGRQGRSALGAARSRHVAHDGEAPADANGDGIRIEPGRRGWADGEGAPVAEDHAHADRQGEPGRAVHGEMGGLGGVAGTRDAIGARLAVWQGERGDARAELAAIERAVGTRGTLWNDGPAGSFRVADGLPAGLARDCVSAYGDAVVPQLTEAVGRAILFADRMMKEAA